MGRLKYSPSIEGRALRGSRLWGNKFVGSLAGAQHARSRTVSETATKHPGGWARFHDHFGLLLESIGGGAGRLGDQNIEGEGAIDAGVRRPTIGRVLGAVQAVKHCRVLPCRVPEK